MKRLLSGALAVVATVAMAACSGHSSMLPNAPTTPVVGGQAVPLTPFAIALLQAPKIRLCPSMTTAHASCYGIISDMKLDLSPNSGCLHQPGCYAPTDLWSAYGIASAAGKGGKGMTVALVDAYGYKGVAKDLAVYRKSMGLPACGKGCFKVIGENGGPPPKVDDSGWDGEQALDVDMVSAICPNCHILLVETMSNQNSDLEVGETTATKTANAISNSWGGPDSYSTGGPFDSHKGIVITASSGDQGAGAAFEGQSASAQQPCSFQGVICVGGTSLVLHNGKRVSEVVWDDLTHNLCSNGPCATGSGCSGIVKKPSWQHDKGCKGRSESDISADADPNTGVAIRWNGNWYSAGGTSASSPMIAAMYALAGNTATASGASLWSKGGTSAFYAITSGTNENKAAGTYVCAKKTRYICNAGTGMAGKYSGPAGWGTPHGLGAL